MRRRMHGCSCAQEASRRLALSLADVLHRQTAESSGIDLDGRLHLEKMSVGETLRIQCREQEGSQGWDKGRGEEGQGRIIK